jgi:hypothetical protein
VQNDDDELKKDLQELRSENLVLKGRMEDTKIDFEAIFNTSQLNVTFLNLVADEMNYERQE